MHKRPRPKGAEEICYRRLCGSNIRARDNNSAVPLGRDRC
jgi:hypothetical protein